MLSIQLHRSEVQSVLRTSLHRACLLLLLVSAGAATARAQGSGTAAAPIRHAHDAQLPNPVSNFLASFDAALTFSTVHDSAIGWYTIATPSVSYTFSPRFSADASFSVYPNRKSAQVPPGTQGFTTLVNQFGDAGDTFLTAHAFFRPHQFLTTSSVTMSVPTGNREDDLSTGRVTFDFDNHTERYVHQTGFILDLGVGDSSGLFNRLDNQDLNALGPLAHFQTGAVVFFPRRTYLQTLAYEQLPIGDQKFYATFPVGQNGRTRTVVAGRNISEDNGITTSAGIPLTSRVTLSGYYNHSMRLHLDTVSTSLTFTLRAIPIRHRLSLADKALLEAETGSE